MDAVDLHEACWRRLHRGRDRLPHALLFAGKAGLGKLEFARAFASALLCESPRDDHRACGACAACNWLEQGNHPDFRWLRPSAEEDVDGEEKAAKETKGGREITIDQVRGLADFLNIGTHRAGVRLVLVSPAEAMNRNTANALLKSLEEPRRDTVFLLVSDGSDRLLPTIRSRCRIEPLATPSPSLAQGYLAERGVADPARWLALAGGAPRLAWEAVSGRQRLLLERLQPGLEQAEVMEPIRLAQDIDVLLRADKSIGLIDPVEWTQRWVFDLMQALYGLSPRYYSASEGVLKRLAGKTAMREVSAFMRKSVEFKRLAPHPLNARLFLEDLFSEYVLLFGVEGNKHG